MFDPSERNRPTNGCEARKENMKTDLDSENLTLRENANVCHESAEDWYDSYGAHISTEECGDICVQAVEFAWLDADKSVDNWRDEALAKIGPVSEGDEAALEQVREINRWSAKADSYAALKVKESRVSMTWDEIESLVDLAKSVREAAVSVESELEAASDAYASDDLDGVIEHLRAASAIEADHGDNPATSALADQLLMMQSEGADL